MKLEELDELAEKCAIAYLASGKKSIDDLKSAVRMVLSQAYGRGRQVGLALATERLQRVIFRDPEEF